MKTSKFVKKNQFKSTWKDLACQVLKNSKINLKTYKGTRFTSVLELFYKS